MNQVVRQFNEPVNMLCDLGVKLQQSINLTSEKLAHIKSRSLKARTTLELERSKQLFNTLSVTVGFVSDTLSFVTKSFGLDLDDLFGLTGDDERIARAASYSALELTNTGIEKQINRLAKLNREIDSERRDHETC